MRVTVDVDNLAAEHRARLASPTPSERAQLDSVYRSPRGQVTYSDRFIPSRASSARLNFSILDRETAAAEQPKTTEREDSNHAYNLLLRTELLGCPSPLASPDRQAGASSDVLRSPCSPARKMFRFKTGDRASPAAGPPAESPYSYSPVGRDTLLATANISPKRAARKIARMPFKVLDAPALQDDFYLNLVDWSSQNVLAVGLGTCVYLWSACTSKVTKLCDFSSPEPSAPMDGEADNANNSVCSVAWSQRGTFLSVGTHRGETQLWDVQKNKMIRSMRGHRQRVGTMAWSAHILSTGSRDKAILHRDVRAPEEYIARLTGHRSEVCGLKWSPDDRELASGGNDNQLYVWNLHATSPTLRFTDHTAAVKAIAWSPHQHGLLASGGGTADRCIRFWNTATGSALNSIDTGSQVCNLSWSKNVNEIVSTHGYSQNQIIVWKYPTMSKLATLTGHTLRVLYLAVSPDGQTIVTGAGDETLRFWNVFPGAKSQGSVHDSSVGSMMRTQIR
ncbi:hypothetical protein WJX72_006157 [[Myrmecia] bisecta]|uniref:CDC20/Fizzy WD40 domain-containing protein n=1 Tax=[Myrmecia] bisecta TaxID=41462 RepID=A0AAW1PGT4_9CHLO